MKIYIPTRGRADVFMSGTLSKIPEGLWRDTFVVTTEDEREMYEKRFNESTDKSVRHRPRFIGFKYDGIAEKRLRIGEHARNLGADKFVMLDDDIDFLIRRNDEEWRLREAFGEEVLTMFQRISNLLDSYAHVGISPREGNNRAGEGKWDQLIKENTRMMRITAYRTEEYLSCEHNRIPVMEDLDVTLQLLRKGHKNAVMYYYANGQKMTNAPGGCSLWRTLELHNGAAHRLAQLHPGLVTTRLKKNKTDKDGFGTRTEVTVQWKKAFKQSTML